MKNVENAFLRSTPSSWTFRNASARFRPSLTAKKNESDVQTKKRKEKIAVHVVKNMISGKIDSLKKKIVAAMEPHTDSIMRCFRTSKQIARFPTHLPFATLAESVREQGTVIASMIMSCTKNRSQMSQLLHGVAFHFMVADFFDAQANKATGNSAAGHTRRKKVSTTTKKGATTKKGTTTNKGAATKKGAKTRPTQKRNARPQNNRRL